MTGSVAPKRVVPTLTEVVEPSDLAFLLDLDLELTPRPRPAAAPAVVADVPVLLDAAEPEVLAVPVPSVDLVLAAEDAVPDLSDPPEADTLRPLAQELAQELAGSLDLALPNLDLAAQAAAPIKLPDLPDLPDFPELREMRDLAKPAPDRPAHDLGFALEVPQASASASDAAAALTSAYQSPPSATVLAMPVSAPITPADPLQPAFAGQEQAIKQAIALAVDEALDQVLDEVLEQAVMAMRAQLHARVESAVWRSLKRQLPPG